MMKKHLPWWTWALPLVVLATGTLLSLPYSTNLGIYWVYFPINLGVVMVMWWGPRVLLSVYLNAMLAATLFGLSNPQLYPLYAIPETLEIFLAWVLLKDRFKNLSSWEPNPKNISLYFVYGLLIPAIIGSVLIQVLLVMTGVTQNKYFLWSVLVTTIGDLTGAVFLSLPLWILLTPLLYKKNLSLFRYEKLPVPRWSDVNREEKILFFSILVGCLILGVSLPLSQTWYVYGIVLLVSSAWYGLHASLLVNTWIMGITITLPKVLHLPWSEEPLLLQTPATLLTLCFCSLITGSAVTSLLDKIKDLSKTEADLSAAKEQAEEASAAKSEFLARMSHEIRTPLNSVLGMLELLKETQLNSDQSRYLTLFSHAGENLKALINDLLDFSKIEAKALNIEDVSYDLHSTIRSVFEILQIKAEEKGLHFELNIAKEVPRFQWGDPTRLRQVLFNLIGNALKFTTEGSVLVNVKILKDPTEKLVIDVQDSGIGIPREKQARLFSPFYQADLGTTRKYGGTGLGLVISKNLIEIMGGRIEMKSLAGRGTQFRVLLPHRPDYSGTLERKVSTVYPWDVSNFQGRYHILLVDDSEDNRVLMIHYLKNLPFDCDEAINGQEAVEKFKKDKFDLIFMDMQMPVMNGYKATETIRHWEEEKHLPHTPIVALTATTVVEDLQRTLACGCDAYTVKPVKKSEILEVLAHNLTTKRPVREAFTPPLDPSI